MTRALLTEKFIRELTNSGFYIAVDAGGLTATLYRDKLVVKNFLVGDSTLEPVGKLSYTNRSVNYDELMRLVRTAA